MNSPRPKPKHGAGHRAAEEADGGHEQRREVGGHAEERHLRDRGELQDPADQPEQRRAARRRRPGQASRTCPEVGLRLGEDLDEVEAAQVGGGRDVDAAVERALAVLDAADRCRSGSPAGTATGRRAVVVPAVMIRSPLRTSWALGTRSKSRSPGVPWTGPMMPGLAGGGLRGDAEVGVGEQHHLGVAAGDCLTLPTSPSPLITGWSTRTPSLEPLLICSVWYQVLGERW